MKTRSRKATVSSKSNSENRNLNKLFKDSNQTPKSLTNNESIKHSTVTKTPFAEISNTIHKNNEVRDSTKRKVSNVHHLSEYSDSPILVSHFKKKLENKLPNKVNTNSKENCSLSEFNDFQSPIIKTRKIKNVASTPINVPDFIENPVTSESKTNNTKVELVKEDSATKVTKRRKGCDQLIKEDANKIVDTPLLNSLPSNARRSMRNKNKPNPSIMNNNVKGPPKISVNSKEEKTVKKKITRASQKSNPVSQNSTKESEENNKIQDTVEKTPISSLPSKVKQKGTRQLKGRKKIKDSFDIESMSINEAVSCDNKVETRKRQNTRKVLPKNINVDTKSQKIATESVQDDEKRVVSVLPSPSIQTDTSDKPPLRLSKREQLALALRQGKLKSTRIPNSSSKEIIFEPAVDKKTAPKKKNIKSIVHKTGKVFLPNKIKSVKLPKLKSVSLKEDSLDGKSPKLTVPCSSVSHARKGPIYLNVSKSPRKRKVLKTRKSISDAYELSIESDNTPIPIVKKKKPKPRVAKPKIAPKKQNKFTVLTTDPNFEKRFHSEFAVESFYGKSEPNIDDHSDDLIMPFDDDIPPPCSSPPNPQYNEGIDDHSANPVMLRNVSNLSVSALHLPKESNDHKFLRPPDVSKISNRTSNSSVCSSKSTPDSMRHISSKNFLGTSTPYTNNSEKMTSSDYCSVPKQPVRTVAEDRAAFFGFDEVEGEEEELQIGLSLPLIKNIQHLLASTGNYSRDSIESTPCPPKSVESNNWSVSQIENISCSSPKLKNVATKNKKKVKENVDMDGTCLFEDLEDEKKIEKSQIAKRFESVENKKCRVTPGIAVSPEKSFVVPANKTYDRQSLDSSRAAFFEKMSGGFPTDDEDENMSQDESEPVMKKKRTKNVLSKTKEVNGKKKETQNTKVSKRKAEKESTFSTSSHLSNSTMNVTKKSKLNEKTIEDWASSMMGHFSEIDESALLVECD